jgi:hypothetical protein
MAELTVEVVKVESVTAHPNAERLELLRLERIKALEFHRQQIKLLGGENGV